MAKKVRTPAPPKRPVQAPQRRDTRKRGTGESDQRRIWTIVAVLVAVAAAAIAAALYFALRHNGGKTSSVTTTGTTSTAFNSLPGVRKTKAPWPPEYAHLSDRLTPLKLDALGGEVLTYHVHQHLDIFLDGQAIEVPALIGINDRSYVTQLHTHVPDGVIHYEAAKKMGYTLGTLFAEWGVYLSKKCVGGYCKGYTWYVNGNRQTGNPENLVLKPHQELVIAIGKPPKNIPSTYSWQGL